MMSRGVGIDSESGVDVEALSHAFVSSLDRTALGRFAADDRAFYLANMIQRTQQVQNSSRDGLVSVRTGTYEMVEELNNLVDERHTSLVEVYAEVFFWWKRSDDEALRAFVEELIEDGSNTLMLMWMGALETIHAHSNMHDYFAAGIWDIELIEGFLAEGIDSSLALDVIAA